MSNNNDSQMSANRYVSTSASDQPQAPNVNESPVASVLQAAASAVGKAAEGLGITGMAAKMKDDTEVQKEWRESGSKGGLIGSQSNDHLLIVPGS